MALNRRNKFFGKWKQAQHEYDYIAKSSKSTPAEKPSSIAKSKALKKEAVAAKKENKAKLDLEKAVTPVEKSEASSAIK